MLYSTGEPLHFSHRPRRNEDFFNDPCGFRDEHLFSVQKNAKPVAIGSEHFRAIAGFVRYDELFMHDVDFDLPAHRYGASRDDGDAVSYGRNRWQNPLCMENEALPIYELRRSKDRFVV